jgi:hypothetical protein
MGVDVSKVSFSVSDSLTELSSSASGASCARLRGMIDLISSHLISSDHGAKSTRQTELTPFRSPFHHTAAASSAKDAVDSATSWNLMNADGSNSQATAEGEDEEIQKTMASKVRTRYLVVKNVPPSNASGTEQTLARSNDGAQTDSQPWWHTPKGCILMPPPPPTPLTHTTQSCRTS